MRQIDNFIKKLQRRLNTQMALREMCSASIVFLSGTLLIALIYFFRGYRVNCNWYFVPLAAAFIFFLLRYISKYCRLEAAADYADRYFDLKNALISELDFAGRSGAFHELRRQQTKGLCDADKLKTIRLKLPRKILLTALALLLLTGFLSMLDDSEWVRNARAREKIIEKNTEELNKELQKKFAEMLKKLKPQEKKMLKKSGLIEAVKKLSKEKELKKALRQYGKLESEINKFAARMKITERERLLRMMSKKLMQSKMTRNFGQKLNSGKYREAGKDLKHNKLKELDPKNQLKKLRLKRILEKMLESAKDADRMNSSLAKNIEKLLESLNECDCKELGDLDEINAELDELCDKLCELDDAKKFLARLKGMCKACNNAQCLCKAGFPAIGKGGKGIGKGIGTAGAGNFNNKTKDPENKGYVTGLKGQKNKGSSRIKIEEAATGHGVSRRSERAVKADFKRRMESFISRDDVPPAMKTGVKEYFTKIHKQENANE
jgi:hypothetical protein